jgi:hypothetical protein
MTTTPTLICSVSSTWSTSSKSSSPKSGSLSHTDADFQHPAWCAHELRPTPRSAAGQIVSELEEAGYLTKTRAGRRNSYEVHGELPLRHPQHRHHTVGELIRFLQAPSDTAPSRS